ncbi:MAG TPA: hypothetical protein VFH54_14120 [Mycobacteriales bacterium]|nr:hypothetical protein [Mycobacteriales bacterium]
MPRLDETVAREVAFEFLGTPSTPRDPKVAAAYKQLQLQSDRLFASLTADAPGGSFRVVFTRCREPYISDVELIRAVRATRLLEVATVAIDRGRLHPFLGNEVGGAYDRFRAVHDLVGHVQNGFGFDRNGEYAAWLAQDGRHSGLARLALATELHAEHSVLWSTGMPADHKAILIAPIVLNRARCGVG